MDTSVTQLSSPVIQGSEDIILGADNVIEQMLKTGPTSLDPRATQSTQMFDTSSEETLNHLIERILTDATALETLDAESTQIFFDALTKDTLYEPHSDWE